LFGIRDFDERTADTGRIMRTIRFILAAFA